MARLRLEMDRHSLFISRLPFAIQRGPDELWTAVAWATAVQMASLDFGLVLAAPAWRFLRVY